MATYCPCDQFIIQDNSDSFETWDGLRGPAGPAGTPGPQGPPGEGAVIDPTLSHSGEAADAKVTGDRLASLAEVLETKAGRLVDTVSGAVASFIPDATIENPLTSLSVAVEPQQDLHGYDSPWPAGGGKNLANPQNSTNPNRSDYSYSTENDYLIEGTKTSAGGKFFAKFTAPVVSGENYIFSFGSWVIGGVDSPCQIYLYEDELWGTKIAGFTVGSENRRMTWTATITGTIVVGIYTHDATTGKTLSLSQFMIRHGSVTDATFAPYSNICPISGWDAVSIWNKPTHDTTADPTVTIQLGQTVYGGTLDVTAGKMTVDRAMVDLGTLTWEHGGSSADISWRTNDLDSLVKLPSSNASSVGAISSAYKEVSYNSAYNSNIGTFGFATSGRLLMCTGDANNAPTGQLVYPLATPFEIPLTPTQIATLVGQNYVWSDAGDVTVEVAADLKWYIDSKIAAAVAALS